MITLKELKERYPAETKEVKVEAWGGSVKIRKLTIDEHSSVEAVIMNNATQEELSEGKLEVSVSKLQESQMLAVSLALVSPKMSMQQLGELPSDAITGVTEIYLALKNWDKPKK